MDVYIICKYTYIFDISLQIVDPAPCRFEHPHSNKMSMAHSAGGPWEIQLLSR